MKGFHVDEILKRMRVLFDVETNKDLAKTIGFTQQAVSGWVTRESIPLDVLLKVGQEKEVSLDWLVYGKEQQAKLDPLENLLLSSFNELDNKAKMSILSLIHNGGKAQGGVSQTSGDNGVNNVFSGDNLTINK